MVSFSCENCGDVLTKKKLDAHRNQCYGASYTCLDCMVHFEGASYKAHTSCITEDQKYQGKLYKDKKKPQHHKKDSAYHETQALVPHNAYVEDAPDYEDDQGAVALVDAPPRAPTPPPASNAVEYEYHEPAALPPLDVFEYMDEDDYPEAPDESRMIEDSVPPPYEQHQSDPQEQEPQTSVVDVLQFQIPDDDNFVVDSVSYGHGPIRPSFERHDSSYNLHPQEADLQFTTPAPKPKHKRTKSKDVDTTIKKTERKRKRNSPAELDLSAIKAQREKDIMMEDAPPMLHSGLTGGLNRLLARPEFPPSPEYSGEGAINSPLSPMKRAKQGASKALLRAQKQHELLEEKQRKADAKEQRAREKEEKRERERGRERERKERKAGSTLVRIRPSAKKRDLSARGSRRQRETERIVRRRQDTSSPSPHREHKTVKTIEYQPADSRSVSPDAQGQLTVRPNGGVSHIRTEHEARADLFMSFVHKGPDSERGMSINKTLKRYHRVRSSDRNQWDHHRETSKADEEKELWRSMRLRRNERGEIVLFFAEPEAA